MYTLVLMCIAFTKQQSFLDPAFAQGLLHLRRDIVKRAPSRHIEQQFPTIALHRFVGLLHFLHERWGEAPLDTALVLREDRTDLAERKAFRLPSLKPSRKSEEG